MKPDPVDLDYATSVAVDSAGNAYVVGYTTSSDFPTRNPAFQIDVSRQRYASFLTKYSTQRAVVYSTYIEGFVAGVAVDASQSPVLVGSGASGGFVRRVRPDKRMLLRLSRPVERRDLEALGSVIEHGDAQAIIQVSQDALQPAVARALSSLPLTDLTVEDPPLEEVMRDLFAQGRAA